MSSEEKKSPLEGLKEWAENMTPEEKKEWADSIRESVKKARKKRDEEKKKNLPSGTCRVCKGSVKADFIALISSRIGYDPRQRQVKPNGYSCRRCGLVYRFPPKDEDPSA